MTPTATLLLTASLLTIAGCRETATCPPGQRYAAEQRECTSTTTSDSGQDAAMDAGADAGPCAACTADEHCDPARGCVECLQNEHCSDPALPLCQDGECRVCSDDAQCAAHAGAPECDPLAGCIACTPANELVLCSDEGTCDVTTGACSPIVPGSLAPCDPCTSDRQCAAAHRCVPMQFGDPLAPRPSAYCLRVRGTDTCTRPTAPVAGRTSLSGVTGEEYCAPNEMLTTCEAVSALRTDQSCDAHTDCAEQGAVCGSVRGTGGKCTYPCGIDADCPTGLTCGVTSNYCGGS